MNVESAAETLYESINRAQDPPHSWRPWQLASDEDKDYYRRLVHRVQLSNVSSSLDGELLIRLPGMTGIQPMKHIFRCQITEESIDSKLFDLRTWLMEVTRNYRG